MDGEEPEQTKTIGCTDKIPTDKLAVSPNDRYHTRHVIGSGGMKIVVKSEDINVGRNIAMAISKDASEQKQLRFLEEARITASLEHPNIVPVHDIGRSKSGVPYFTMKLVHGVTLAKILDSLRSGDPAMQKRFPLHVRLDIFLKIFMPLSRPTLYSVAILVFIDYWNMVEQPLILLTDAEMYPLSVFLSQINQGDTGVALAIAVIYMVPPVLLFLYSEDYLIDGISYSASVKG